MALPCAHLQCCQVHLAWVYSENYRKRKYTPCSPSSACPKQYFLKPLAEYYVAGQCEVRGSDKHSERAWHLGKGLLAHLLLHGVGGGLVLLLVLLLLLAVIVYLQQQCQQSTGINTAALPQCLPPQSLAVPGATILIELGISRARNTAARRGSERVRCNVLSAALQRAGKKLEPRLVVNLALGHGARALAHLLLHLVCGRLVLLLQLLLLLAVAAHLHSE